MDVLQTLPGGHRPRLFAFLNNQPFPFAVHDLELSLRGAAAAFRREQPNVLGFETQNLRL